MNPTRASRARKRFNEAMAVAIVAVTCIAIANLVEAAETSTLSVGDVAVFEQNNGTSILTFVITRTGTSGRSSVSYVVSNGTAQAGSDFIAVPASGVNFAQGETTKTVPVTINGDLVPEPDETITITLSSPVTATIADGSGTGRILNDDLPTLSVNDVSVTEGNSGTKLLNFSVTRSAAVGANSSVTFATANGTAVAGTDYVARPATTLNFSGGDTGKTVAVTINGDTTGEPNETFTLILSSPVGATIADGSATGTIQNDDQPKLSVNNVKTKEGNSGQKLLTFTITRSGDLSSTSSVSYATANDTAIAGSDYVALPLTTLNFAPNQETGSVNVTINGDVQSEANEIFSLKLSNPTGATLENSSGTGTIENDDVPTVSVSNASTIEGNSGTKIINFTVTLSGPAAGASVKYTTLNDTATAGTDYGAHLTTKLEFQSGETSKIVDVKVVGDTQLEPNETFQVKLSDPEGVSILDDLGIGTIISDDSSLTVNDLSRQEANIGNPPIAFNFTITRTGSVFGEISVVYATSNGTATAGSDYVALPPTTLTFLSGQDSKTVSVPITPDNVQEPDETFTLNLSSPVGATITDGTGLATIQDDDHAPLEATLSVNDITVTEGTSSSSVSATFTITRSGNLSGTSSVVIATGGGTAQPSGATGSGNTDYTKVNPITLTFAPNVAVLTRAVSVRSDDFVENEEFFNLNLSNPSGATIADGSGKATIVDDDEFHFTVNDVSVIEGNTGSPTLTFTVFRLPPGDRGQSTVAYTITDVSATFASDYEVAQNGTLVFAFHPSGLAQLSQTVAVRIISDTIGEPDETFTLNLSSPTDAIIDDSSATGTITNDDTSLSINDVSIAEGDTGTKTLTFTVTRTGGLGAASSVTFATSNGSAAVGSDYVGIPPTPLNFLTGQTTKTIAVSILPDKDVEPNESFNVNLSGATGAVITDGVGAGAIVNDD